MGLEKKYEMTDWIEWLEWPAMVMTVLAAWCIGSRRSGRRQRAEVEQITRRHLR